MLQFTDQCKQDESVEGMRAPAGEISGEFAEIVESIQRGEQAGVAALYRKFERGIRLLLVRSIDYQDVDDCTQTALLTVVEAIQKGTLRNPSCLPGFVRGVVQNHNRARIQCNIAHRAREVDVDSQDIADVRSSPEERVALKEQIAIAQNVLLGLSARAREVLVRFYLQEQPKEQICAEMRMTETQFRLLKSRAKARFVERCQERLAPRMLQPVAFAPYLNRA